MGVTLEKEEGNVRTLRVAGMLKKSEFDAVITAEAGEWKPETNFH